MYLEAGTKGRLQIVKNVSSKVAGRQREEEKTKASLLQPSVIIGEKGVICWGEKSFFLALDLNGLYLRGSKH